MEWCSSPCDALGGQKPLGAGAIWVFCQAFSYSVSGGACFCEILRGAGCFHCYLPFGVTMGQVLSIPMAVAGNRSHYLRHAAPARDFMIAGCGDHG